MENNVGCVCHNLFSAVHWSCSLPLSSLNHAYFFLTKELHQQDKAGVIKSYHPLKWENCLPCRDSSIRETQFQVSAYCYLGCEPGNAPHADSTPGS